MAPSHPYLPLTPAERKELLKAIGVDSFDQLVEYIPKQALRPRLNLPAALSEPELSERLAQLAARNSAAGANACFLGGGARYHYIPAVIGALISRGEFLTSYTPYQPEVAQGTLQAGFEFQSLICDLFNMEVANLGMYDGATAFAEAHLMACRITRRSRVAILDSVDERMVEVLATYTKWQGIELVRIPADAPDLPADIASLGVQSPNFLGGIEDVARLTEAAHKAGALCVTHADPVASCMFAPPGDFGVDIVTAEGQPLGVPLSFGGAYIGLFACKKSHVRQMPGRIAGMTTDSDGQRTFVLTLQTREQHIRRERATSNICTSTQLIALMNTIYLALMGPDNMRQLAETCYHKAHYAAATLDALKGYTAVRPRTFFNEFVLKCPAPPAEINRALLEEGVIGGLDVSNKVPNGMLLCFTEMNSRAQIDRLAQLLERIAR